MIKLYHWRKLVPGLAGFAPWQLPTPQGGRFESRLAAILAPDNAAGNLIEIVQRMPARLTAVSQDLVLGRARTRPAALGSVIGW